MILMGRNPSEFEALRLIPRSFIPYKENPLPRYIGFNEAASQISAKHYSQFIRFS